MLESLAAWFTPTSLFLLLNIVIGTIYITSLFGTKKHHLPPQQHQYNSSPSLFDRVKSINFGLHNYDHHNSDSNNDHYEHEYANTTAQPPELAGAPSLLARVKSVNFSDFQFSFGAEPQNQEQEPVTDPNPVQFREPEAPALRSRLMARAPSILKRVKSITFTDLPQISLFRSEPIPEPEALAGEPEPVQSPDREEGTHVRRNKSDHKKAAGGAAEKLKKSASEKMVVAPKKVEDEKEVERRRPATARVERTMSIGDVEVDSKADDFINKFKNQLKLQRLNSFVQYTDMITRGSSR